MRWLSNLFLKQNARILPVTERLYFGTPAPNTTNSWKCHISGWQPPSSLGIVLCSSALLYLNSTEETDIQRLSSAFGWLANKWAVLLSVVMGCRYIRKSWVAQKRHKKIAKGIVIFSEKPLFSPFFDFTVPKYFVYFFTDEEFFFN